MSDTTLLLARLKTLGVQLSVDGANLRYKPVSAVPPELVEAMRQHKAELKRQHKPELKRQLIIEQAYALANKVGEALGIARSFRKPDPERPRETLSTGDTLSISSNIY